MKEHIKYQWLYLDNKNKYRLTVGRYITANEAFQKLSQCLEVIKPIKETALEEKNNDY